MNGLELGAQLLDVLPSRFEPCLPCLSLAGYRVHARETFRQRVDVGTPARELGELCRELANGLSKRFRFAVEGRGRFLPSHNCLQLTFRIAESFPQIGNPLLVRVEAPSFDREPFELRANGVNHLRAVLLDSHGFEREAFASRRRVVEFALDLLGQLLGLP